MNGDEEKADNNNDALEFHHGYLENDYLANNLLIKNNQESRRCNEGHIALQLR